MLREKSKTCLDIYCKEVWSMPDEQDYHRKNCDRAKKKDYHGLVQSNLKLVIAIAREYENRGLPIEDLISEGNIGLVSAAKKFDPDTGTTFSTYAQYWIRQRILQAFSNQARAVRLPVNKIKDIHALNRAESRMEKELNRMPTTAELADHLDVGDGYIYDLRSICRSVLSLDEPVRKTEDNPYAEPRGMSVLDVLPDEGPSPEDMTADHEQTAYTQRLLDVLDDRERSIVCAYFGYEGDGGQTLQEIGARLKLTKERIRQIRDVAIEKMRKRATTLAGRRRLAGAGVRL